MPKGHIFFSILFVWKLDAHLTVWPKSDSDIIYRKADKTTCAIAFAHAMCVFA